MTADPWLHELMPETGERLRFIADRILDTAAADTCGADTDEREVLAAAVGWLGLVASCEVAMAGAVALIAAVHRLAAATGQTSGQALADVRSDCCAALGGGP